jgi:HK97 gp10 family phage protein
MDAAVQEALDATGKAAKALAQSFARVDTGEMRDGLDYIAEARGVSNRRTLVVFGTAKHTVLNELGTSLMSAQPMIRPAIDAEAPRLTQRLQAAFRKIR